MRYDDAVCYDEKHDIPKDGSSELYLAHNERWNSKGEVYEEHAGVGMHAAEMGPSSGSFHGQGPELDSARCQ
jgi:hypothetical protein